MVSFLPKSCRLVDNQNTKRRIGADETHNEIDINIKRRRVVEEMDNQYRKQRRGDDEMINNNGKRRRCIAEMDNQNRKRRRGKEDVGRRPICLPDDIIYEILVRLPVQTILRCRSVCKSWNELTHRDDFISSQLRTANSRPLGLIVEAGILDTTNIVYPHERVVKPFDFLDALRKSCGVYIKCACDGLLCLASEIWFDQVYICNPITEQFVKLPPSRPKMRLTSENFGFGFDRLSRKYKVVREYQISEDDDPQFEILTLGESSWRRLSSQSKYVSFCGTAVECNGCLYWLNNRVEQKFSILAFDLSTEEFYTISYPLTSFSSIRAEPFEVLGQSLVVLDETLAVVEQGRKKIIIWKIIGNRTEGFSMSKEVLNKKCRKFYRSYDIHRSGYIVSDRQYATRKDDELLFIDLGAGIYVDGYVKGLPLPRTSHALHFKPTLVSPLAVICSNSSNINLGKMLSLLCHKGLPLRIHPSAYGCILPRPIACSVSSLPANTCCHLPVFNSSSSVVQFSTARSRKECSIPLDQNWNSGSLASMAIETD